MALNDFILMKGIYFSSGQFIDTEIVPSNHKTEIYLNDPWYINDKHWFGCYADSGNNRYYHFTTYSDSYYWGRNLDSGEDHGGTYTRGKHHLIYNGDNNSVILDGTTLGSGVNITSTSNLYLGSREGVNNFVGWIYSFKLTDKSTNNLVREFIPVKRISDSTLGFYDLVDGKFYTNGGTGSFIAEPLKFDGYTKLEYIESNGTQFIDTGIKLSDYGTANNTNFEIRSNMSFVDSTPPSDRAYLFGIASYHSNGAAYGAMGANGADSDSSKRDKILGFVNGSTNYASYSGPAYDNLKHEFRMLRRGTATSTAGFYIGDSLFKQYAINISTYFQPVTIFGGWWKTSSSSNFTPMFLSKARLYDFEIYGGNQLVSSLLPMKRLSDGEIGLYDWVRDQFFISSIGDPFTEGTELTKYTVSVNISPSTADGEVIGSGEYYEGDSAVLLYRNVLHSYKFKKWLDGGVEIWDKNPYMFTVEDNLLLTVLVEEVVSSCILL